ncbi:MAG: PQQ-binding-like beta-propeller repeat protein [Bacillota bacterium]
MGLFFLALYPLGHVRGGTGIHDFQNVQQYVMGAAVPLGMGLAVGFLLSVRFGPILRRRFLWSALTFFLIQLCILNRLPAFMPFFVIHGVPIPNPIAWGILIFSAGVATYTSLKMDTFIAGGAPTRLLSRFVVLTSVVVLVASSAALAPAFVMEWRRVPVVLDDRWTLVWEQTVPEYYPREGAGFWFPERQVAPRLYPQSEFVEAQRISETGEAVFATKRWIGLIRLSDGEIVWSREMPFRVSGDQLGTMNIYTVEDRIHVIVRGPNGDIHTFRKSDGELLWEAKDLGFKYGPIGDLRVGAVPTPNFILATFADGRPGYMVIDSKTGAVTEHSLPVPEGMTVPSVDLGAQDYVLGPVVLEGDPGTWAIWAYFADSSTVLDGHGPGSTITEKGFLFGIDPETGKIAWQVEGVGDWHDQVRWPLQDMWFDASTVVWTGGYGSTTIRCWDTSSGTLRWSRDFADISWAAAGPDGVALRQGSSSIHFVDILTGDVKWTYDPGTLDLYSMFFVGDTFVLGTSGSARHIAGIRTSDGSVIFELPIHTSYRILGIQDGDLVLETRYAAGSHASRIDVETGEQSPFGWDDFSGALDLETSRYLLSLRKRFADSESPRHDLFKAEGELQLMNRFLHPVQTYGSLGEVLKEGSILVTSYDDKADVYHVYMLKRK